jgi:hypothetical protein
MYFYVHNLPWDIILGDFIEYKIVVADIFYYSIDKLAYFILYKDKRANHSHTVHDKKGGSKDRSLGNT